MRGTGQCQFCQSNDLRWAGAQAIRCEFCQGAGVKISGEECPHCHGAGNTVSEPLTNEFLHDLGLCGTCHGTGQTLAGAQCLICHGAGTNSGKPELEFHFNEKLEPVVRFGGWIKAWAKALWGGKS
jgi:DnaJ-class molecular chaperone